MMERKCMCSLWPNLPSSSCLLSSYMLLYMPCAGRSTNSCVIGRGHTIICRLWQWLCERSSGIDEESCCWCEQQEPGKVFDVHCWWWHNNAQYDDIVWSICFACCLHVRTCGCCGVATIRPSDWCSCCGWPRSDSSAMHWLAMSGGCSFGDWVAIWTIWVLPMAEVMIFV